MIDFDEIKNEIKKQALINAVTHNGKAEEKAVFKKLLVAYPQIKERLSDKKFRDDLLNLVKEVVKEINSLKLGEQTEILAKEYNITLELIKEEKSKKTREGLPPLPDAEKFEKIVTRFAPAPSGALHIGQVLRAAFINYLYAKQYNGKFILRIEDTDPRRIKKIYYDWILEDLKALGIEWDELVFESDHFEIYYEFTRKLFEMGKAYVCKCNPEEFQKYKEEKRACPHRDSLDTVDEWEKMLRGEYREGEAVVRLKTRMDHPNPAVRDPPLLRIIDTVPHPRTGYKYRVYPLYNFAVVIEDHISGVTHVIRGKEHQTNEEIQNEIYSAFGWKPPIFIEYGMIKLPEIKIHKRHIRSKLKEGSISGWDDVTLPTVRAFLRRGIHPETFKRLSLLVGLSKSDITLDYENIYSHNRQILSKIAKRIFFVENPYKMEIENVPNVITVKMDWIPGNKEAGKREYKLYPIDGKITVYVSSTDLELLESTFRRNEIIRLKDLMNVKISSIDIKNKAIKAEYYSLEVIPGIQKIHWCPSGDLAISAKILMPDGSIKEGFVEFLAQTLKEGEYVQFERVGFGRLDKNEGELLIFTFAHI